MTKHVNGARIIKETARIHTWHTLVPLYTAYNYKPEIKAYSYITLTLSHNTTNFLILNFYRQL